jgi:hypothetical protein
MPEHLFPGVEYFILKKSLYGIKQAAMEFYLLLNEVLVTKLKFQVSKNDPCLFYKRVDGKLHLVGSHVDDLLIAMPPEHMSAFVADLSACLRIVYHGYPTLYLGMKVSPHSDGSITLSQSAFISDLLTSVKMGSCSSATTPMGTTLPKPRAPNEAVSALPYRAIIGSLNYLCNTTRPDIAFATGVLARFVSDPSEQHDRCVKRVLRYLQGTRQLGVTFRCPNFKLVQPPLLLGYSDSDYANAADSKSVSGSAILHHGNLIFWKSKKQRRVAHSVCEAELLSLASVVKESIYYANLTTELGLVTEPTPFIALGDNSAMIQIAHTGTISDAMKHVAPAINAVHEAIVNKSLSLYHVESARNCGDFFTKPLPADKFIYHRDALGMSHAT